MSLPHFPGSPFVLGAQPATLMAAAPVRQRSGTGGSRPQIPPCYYEGYLEKRGPKEKVRTTAAESGSCCFGTVLLMNVSVHV